jgi:hypothetical protein
MRITSPQIQDFRSINSFDVDLRSSCKSGHHTLAGHNKTSSDLLCLKDKKPSCWTEKTS